MNATPALSWPSISLGAGSPGHTRASTRRRLTAVPDVGDPPTPVTSARDLTGIWSRSLHLSWDGRIDDGSDVMWLQSHSLFVDLRVPPAGALDARLDGSAGHISFEGGTFYRTPLVDLRSRVGVPAEAMLTFEGGQLVELGAYDSYRGHWHEVDAYGPVTSMLLRGEDDCAAVLVSVGQFAGLAWSGPDGGPSKVVIGRWDDGDLLIHAASSPEYVDERLTLFRRGREVSAAPDSAPWAPSGVWTVELMET